MADSARDDSGTPLPLASEKRRELEARARAAVERARRLIGTREVASELGTEQAEDDDGTRPESPMTAEEYTAATLSDLYRAFRMGELTGRELARRLRELSDL